MTRGYHLMIKCDVGLEWSAANIANAQLQHHLVTQLKGEDSLDIMLAGIVSRLGYLQLQERIKRHHHTNTD